jgi:hypothetical protein
MAGVILFDQLHVDLVNPNEGDQRRVDLFDE